VLTHEALADRVDRLIDISIAHIDKSHCGSNTIVLLPKGGCATVVHVDHIPYLVKLRKKLKKWICPPPLVSAEDEFFYGSTPESPISITHEYSLDEHNRCTTEIDTADLRTNLNQHDENDFVDINIM
jgi:hypothetical protein